MKVRYSYLPQQFAECEDLWIALRQFVSTGDFTLGQPLTDFENAFARLIGTRFALGVNSGTDAIKLSLRAAGVVAGDEVITAANTFVATVGAISELGAVPVFVDSTREFCMNPDALRDAITDRTRAIVPVHFTGYMADMDAICAIADDYGLPVIEDACQSILGSLDGKPAGTWGLTGAFSLHPLKNINVWADGGVITTNDERVFAELKLLRNHGLADRDTVEVLGYNSRLDTFQAVVASWLLPQAEDIAESRIQNAMKLDVGLRSIPGISIPDRPERKRVVFHLYSVFAERRDELVAHCLARGVSAKVHYPVPIYRQPALSSRGYSRGDFPVTDWLAESSVSFPCDQHLDDEQLNYIIEVVRSFYCP